MATTSKQLPPMPECPPILPNGEWDPVVLAWLKQLAAIVKILRTEV